MAAKIELLKIRDLGEVVTDTFIFVRQNFKEMIKCFFIFCGFFLLAGALFGAMQQVKMLGTLNYLKAGAPPQLFDPERIFANFGLEYFLQLFFLMLGYIMIQVTTLSYMALYKEKGNMPPTTEEVWGYIKYFYFKLLGSGIVIGLLVIVATLLCILPGVYLYPIMALVFPIMVYENTSFGYAFNRSFKLIKENWWLTFGCIVIMSIIVSMASMIFLLPAMVINIINMVLHITKGEQVSFTLTIITTLVESLGHLFYMVPIVTISLCYFNLTETLDGTGLIGRLGQLGNAAPENNAPAEEEEY